VGAVELNCDWRMVCRRTDQLTDCCRAAGPEAGCYSAVVYTWRRMITVGSMEAGRDAVCRRDLKALQTLVFRAAVSAGPGGASGSLSSRLVNSGFLPLPYPLLSVLGRAVLLL